MAVQRAETGLSRIRVGDEISFTYGVVRTDEIVVHIQVRGFNLHGEVTSEGLGNERLHSL